MTIFLLFIQALIARFLNYLNAHFQWKKKEKKKELYVPRECAHETTVYYLTTVELRFVFENRFISPYISRLNFNQLGRLLQ